MRSQICAPQIEDAQQGVNPPYGVDAGGRRKQRKTSGKREETTESQRKRAVSKRKLEQARGNSPGRFLHVFRILSGMKNEIQLMRELSVASDGTYRAPVARCFGRARVGFSLCSRRCRHTGGGHAVSNSREGSAKALVFAILLVGP